MRRLLIALFMIPLVVHAQRINVRILSTMKVSVVNISVQRGNYRLFLDGIQQTDTLLTKVFQLAMKGDSVEVRIPGDTLGLYGTFYLQAMNDTSTFRIKPIVPNSGTRTYDAELRVSVVGGQLF